MENSYSYYLTIILKQNWITKLFWIESILWKSSDHLNWDLVFEDKSFSSIQAHSCEIFSHYIHRLRNPTCPLWNGFCRVDVGFSPLGLVRRKCNWMAPVLLSMDCKTTVIQTKLQVLIINFIQNAEHWLFLVECISSLLTLKWCSEASDQLGSYQ